MLYKEFSRRNLRRCQAPNGFNHKIDSWDTSDWFLATFGELGEAANVAKKLNRIRDGIRGNKETKEELLDKLRREIGDAGVYLDLLAQAHGFNLFDAMIEVYESKSKEIGYVEEVEEIKPNIWCKPDDCPMHQYAGENNCLHCGAKRPRPTTSRQGE